jgi:prolyl-tRNA editing enzyme YbaK/EbsC (Cys-tRNA(Pro) deacylase)
MRVDAVKAVLASHGLAEAYMEFAVSSATVDLAAAAVGCEPGRIAKSLSVMGMDGPMVLVVMGTARLDNRKFKDVFGCKPRFIKPEELSDMVGHPMGGVCPFALPEGVAVYLDESLKRYDPVYPAAGAPNNAAKLTLAELERVTGGVWVDVCKNEES